MRTMTLLVSNISNVFPEFSGAAKVVDSLGKAIDKLVTSDEARKKLKVTLEEEMNGFKVAHLATMADYDKEITLRHSNDLKSDSWLSKNVNQR